MSHPRNTGPRTFYRVQDDSSHTIQTDEGLYAQQTNSNISFKHSPSALLCEVLENHLDWSCAIPTPFISVYADRRAAEREAERRHREYHDNVCIITIDLTDLRGVEWRELRRLAERHGLPIENVAWHNSESEFVFLEHIPAEAIVSVEYL